MGSASTLIVSVVGLEKIWPLRHNIILWFDEEGKAHRRMLWKRLNRGNKVYRIPDGISNPML